MHWMMKFFEPVNMDDVKYAKEMLRNPIFERTPINDKYVYDSTFAIDNVEVLGYSVKDVKTSKGVVDKGAVYFKKGDKAIQLGLSYYPSLRFSIPKSQLKSYETEETEVPQKIVITSWAFTNCYMLAVNKIYEDWGRMIRALYTARMTKSWDRAPMFKYNPYRKIIETLHTQKFKEMMNDYNKKRGITMENDDGNKPKVVQQERNKAIIQPKTKPIISNGNKNNGNSNGIKKRKKIPKKVNGINHKPFREDAEWLFYSEGVGNLAKGKKFKDKAHYSIFLKNSDEKWKRKQDKLTLNQAELYGVMASISIFTKRNYKNGIIFTSSKNVIKWLTKKEDSDDYVQKANHPNIKDIVDECRIMLLNLSNLKTLQIKYISRDYNYAHPI